MNNLSMKIAAVIFRHRFEALLARFWLQTGVNRLSESAQEQTMAQPQFWVLGQKCKKQSGIFKYQRSNWVSSMHLWW
jgi:hypothetical protein